MLQLKLLMTIMIMETVISGWPAYDPSPRPIGSSAAAVLLALSLCGIAIFVRRPWSAWAAAAVLSLATAGYAAIAITGHQLSDLVGVVWLGLVGTYLFTKAATRGYWSWRKPDPVPQTTTGPASALGSMSLAVSTVAVVLCCCGTQLAEPFGIGWQTGVAGAAGIAGLIGAVSGHLALGRVTSHGLSGRRIARAGLRLGWIVAMAGLFYALELQPLLSLR